VLKLRDGRWYQSVKAVAPRGVSGKNRGGIDFAVAGTAILARLLQQNLPDADLSMRSITWIEEALFERGRDRETERCYSTFDFANVVYVERAYLNAKRRRRRLDGAKLADRSLL
jgi:hypothetical protein